MMKGRAIKQRIFCLKDYEIKVLLTYVNSLLFTANANMNAMKIKFIRYLYITM
jgi:hypothetical protein